MRRPSRENSASEIEAMISLKYDFEAGSSSSSNTLAWRSQSAAWRMSPSLMLPREVQKRKMCECSGWKSWARGGAREGLW